MSRLTALLGVVAVSAVLGAQAPVPLLEPRFEAATLKINRSGEARGRISAMPESGRLTVTNSRVNELIQSAYGLQLPTQLVNVPDWARSTRVDVIAKADRPAPLRVLQRMLIPLLAETLNLSVHRETRDMDAFALVLANSDRRPGPNLKKTAVDCGNALGTTMQFNRVTPAAPGNAVCGIQAADGPGRIIAIGVDIGAIAALIAPSQRPVIDRTELTGRYDINVTYTPEAFSAAAGRGAQRYADAGRRSEWPAARHCARTTGRTAPAADPRADRGRRHRSDRAPLRELTSTPNSQLPTRPALFF